MSRFIDVLRTGSFVRIWMAIAVSTAGNFLLMLSLSVYVYRLTSSNFAAAAVFATQWLAAIFSAPLVGMLAQRVDSRRLSAFSEWSGGCVSLLIGASLLWLPAIYVLLFVRGLTESVGKSARVVALKEHVAEGVIERAASLVGTATFLGIAFGSLSGAWLVGMVDMFGIAVIDCLTFMVSGLLYFSLTPHGEHGRAAPVPLRNITSAGLDAIRADAVLMRNFAYVVITTAFFQGFHNIARTMLPIRHLQMGEQGVMYLQAIASASFFIGSVFVAASMQRDNRAGRTEPWVICAVTGALMLVSILFSTPLPSLVAYALYLFLFEVGFTFCQKNMIIACPKEKIGLVSPLAVAAATSGMVAVIYLGGWLSDQLGLLKTVMTMVVLLLASMLAIELSIPRAGSMPALDKTSREGK